MINRLKPYPAYKDSGVEWLGEAPEHWDVLPNRALFTEVRERDHPEEQMLSVTINKGIIRQEALLADSSKKDSSNQDKSAYKLVRSGDIVYNKMRAWQGAVGVSNYQGIVSPAYVVQRPREGICSRYIHYLFRTPDFAKEAERWSYGITSDMWSLRPEHFKMIYACLPPDEEQTAIVRFLNHVDRRIRRYIRAKQKLIKLLEEQITLKAAEAMRDPACRSARLDTIAVQELRTVTRESANSYIALGLYNRGRGLFHKAPIPGSDLGDSTFFWVEPGDLVISGQFAWEGAVALASSNEKNMVVSHRYYLLKGSEGMATTPYLWALLRSNFGEMLLDHHSRGAAGRNRPLNIGKLMKEKIPLPPFENQLAIDELVRSVAPIRDAIEREVSLLHEYRTRLIADVVTGKLDVREAAANLPEEPEAGAPEPLDETEMESGEDEDIADEDREAVSGEVG